MTRTPVALFALSLAAACSDVEGGGGAPDENEVITTVALAFTPAGGGAATTFTWADPENDGAPVIDDVALPASTSFTVAVSFLNELAEPAEDLTEEVADESDEHQVFFTGTAVEGPATGADPAAVLEHAYADEDAGGLPVGLDNTVTTRAAGSGELVVTLRHMPPEDGVAVKIAGAAEVVADEGFGALGGDNDAQVTFAVSVE